MTIKTRLLLLILVSSLVSVGVGYQGLRQAAQSTEAFNSIFDHRVVGIGFLKSVQSAYIVDVQRTASNFVDGRSSPEEAAAQLATVRASIGNDWPKFVALQDSDVDKQLVEVVESVRAGVDDFADRLDTLFKTGPAARASVRKLLDEEWYAVADPLAEQLNTLYDTQQSEARNDFADLASSNAQRRTLQLVAVGIGLCVSLLLGWTVLRTVTRSLSLVRVQLHELSAGGGDLTRRLQVGEDEVGAISAEVNLLMEKLLGLVRRIQESGIQVTSSSTELSGASHALEATLNQQVASTNEVVASAREIAATSQSLVKTMSDVAELSQEAARSAAEGQTGLTRMHETMRTMEGASTSIAQKLAAINAKVANITTVVTTINKVADQTNLLSLNAAIEAAKAGEFGQGFAVVAREIRRLADQTAVATLDIDQMVKEMQSSVSAGVMSMEKFAQDVQGAVHEVQEISGQITSIITQVQGLGPRFESVNEGMESQSLGARQISDAMAQLSEATGATAERQRESAEAIRSLEQAARILHQEVSRFKVTDASVPAAVGAGA